MKKILFLMCCLCNVLQLISSGEKLLTTATACTQLFFTPSIVKTLQKSPAFTYEGQTSHTVYPAPSRPLLTSYPNLAKDLPWIELATLPTPVIHLTTLSTQYHIRHLYMKDDGKTASCVGGNKVRKLELLFAHAIWLGARHVITFGCAGSNHAAATAFHAKRLGLSCSLFLKDQPNSTIVQNNLLIDNASGARIFYYPSNELRTLGALNEFVQRTYNDGQFPYVIGTGGSSPLGTIGYVNAIFELKEQITQGLMPEPDFIYCAAGSLGTITGLLLGIRAAGLHTQLIPIAVEPTDESQASLMKLLRLTNDLLHTLDATFPLFTFTTNDVTFNLDLQGPDYGVITPEARAALTIFKEQQGILLETTYSAKAAAALLQDLATKPELRTKTILFWNTFGIEQQTFSEDAYTHLPKPFHAYFEN